MKTNKVEEKPKPVGNVKKAAGKDDESEDPIAQSLALRIKSGGTVTSVVAEGGKKSTTTAPAKPTGGAGPAPVKPAEAKVRPQTAAPTTTAKPVEEKKVPAPQAAAKGQ